MIRVVCKYLIIIRKQASVMIEVIYSISTPLIINEHLNIEKK